MRRERLLLTMALSIMCSNFFSNPYFAVVLPVFSKEELESARALGLLLGAFGGGAFLGMLAYGWIGYRFSRRKLWLLGYSVAAFLYWVLLPEPPLAVLLLVSVLIGFLGGPVGPLSVTVRHERIPAHLRGRAFGAFSAICMAGTPLGIAISGLAIDNIGLRWTIAVSAILYQLVGVAFFFIPAFHELDRRPHAE
jgi:MFS family permease